MSLTTEHLTDYPDDEFDIGLDEGYSNESLPFAHVDVEDTDFDGSDFEGLDEAYSDELDEALDYFKLSSEAKAKIDALKADFDDVRYELAYTMIQEGKLSRYLQRKYSQKRNLRTHDELRIEHDSLMQRVYEIIDEDFESYDSEEDIHDDSPEARAARDTELINHFQLFMALERKQIDETKLDILSNGRFGRFLRQYDRLGKVGKIAAGVTVGAGAGIGLSFLGVGAAIAGASGMTIRFGRGYVNNARRFNNHDSEEAYNAIASSERNFDDEDVIGTFSNDLYDDLDKDIKRDRKANYKTLGKTVGTIAAGAVVGHFAHDFISDKLSHKAGGSHAPASGGHAPQPGGAALSHQPAGTAGHETVLPATDDVAVPTTIEVQPHYEDFTYLPHNGDGITYALKDLALHDSQLNGLGGKLAGKDLYDVYQQYEGQLAALPNTYDMGNGDFGIASPNQAFTIPAELRAHIIDSMRAKVGLGPVEAITQHVDTLSDTAVDTTHHVSGGGVVDHVADTSHHTPTGPTLSETHTGGIDDYDFRPGADIAETHASDVQAPSYNLDVAAQAELVNQKLVSDTPSAFAKYLAVDSALTQTDISIEAARRLSDELGERVVYVSNDHGGAFRLGNELLNRANQLKVKQIMLKLIRGN